MLKPIHTPADYEAALAEVSALIDVDPPKGSPDGDRLEILATLVESYERDLVDMSLPAPVELAVASKPLAKTISDVSRELEALLHAQASAPKDNVATRTYTIIKSLVELNNRAVNVSIVAQKREMARLIENVQLQVEQAQGLRRVKTGPFVRRSSKKPIKAAPIHFKQAA